MTCPKCRGPVTQFRDQLTSRVSGSFCHRCDWQNGQVTPQSRAGIPRKYTKAEQDKQRAELLRAIREHMGVTVKKTTPNVGAEKERRLSPQQIKDAKIKGQVRELNSKGWSQQEICIGLDDLKCDRPMNAVWRNLSWSGAYEADKFNSAVKKWLSKHGK